MTTTKHMYSKFLSPETLKAYDENAKKVMKATRATEIKDISEIVNLINETDKRNIRASVSTWGEKIMFSDVGAIVEGDVFSIIDNANPKTRHNIKVDNIRAYHENDVSISIYTKNSEIIILRHVA